MRCTRPQRQFCGSAPQRAVIVRQAEGGAMVAANAPARAAGVLRTICEVGRDALADMRGLLGLLSSPMLARETGERGRQAVAQSRGAVERLVALVEPLLSPRACEPRAAVSASSETR